jgi:hypothetical protein
MEGNMSDLPIANLSNMVGERLASELHKGLPDGAVTKAAYQNEVGNITLATTEVVDPGWHRSRRSDRRRTS